MWGGAVIQWEAPLKGNYSKEVTLAFKNAKNKTGVAVLLFPR